MSGLLYFAHLFDAAIACGTQHMRHVYGPYIAQCLSDFLQQ